MKKQTLTLFVIIFATVQSVFSQAWIETWQKENNFYTIRDAFNAYCKEHAPDAAEKENSEDNKYANEDEGLFPGYVQFKRWEWYMAPRVYPGGNISATNQADKNYSEFLEKNIQNTPKDRSTAWTAMGPMGNLSGVATNGLPRKAGRINFITLDPTNPNTFWVGAPAGGLWKTTDHGATWTTNTDNLAIIGCTDMKIDPVNPNIMYLATGDGYASSKNPSSIGVLKSTDGGQTWGATGLVFPLSQKTEIRDLIINPLNPLIIMAATNFGIYRSTTGGIGAWTQVIATNTFDLEFKPTNPDTVYASGIRFRRSVDAGVTWTQISAGIPTSGTIRMETAVTPANPNLVYVVSANNTNNGLQGVYRSTDAGTTFTTMTTTPNILGNDCFITAVGGQGSYDLGFAASPLNQNEIVVGGLGVWQSADGGTTWNNTGCAYNWSSNVPFVHTDHQELEYTANGVLYDVNDGGICEYTGTSWTDLTNPMNIAQIYKIGLSGMSPNLWITGHQDDGSNIYNNGIYSASLAADGTDNFIDRTNDLTMYASISSGSFYKSTDGGISWNPCITGVGNPSGFVTPWKQDPQVATTLYAGRAQMYKSINSAGTWAPTPGVMSGVVSTEFITEFAIAPSNNQYIYAIHGTTGMFVSTDAGNTWTLSNTGLPVANAAGTFVTVNPANPLMAWATFSGYLAGNKVFRTLNGGATWQNISYNLPNLPTNCSVFETGNINDRIYVGMEVGVYYIDSASVSWTLYNTGLPNTPVMDMEISPAAPTRLVAATFGRGVYASDFGTSTVSIPVAKSEVVFNIFPNPTSDKLTIRMNADKATDIEFVITTLSGSIVFRQSCRFANDKSEQQLNIASLAGGIYFLKIISKEGTSQSIKIIKK